MTRSMSRSTGGPRRKPCLAALAAVLVATLPSGALPLGELLGAEPGAGQAAPAPSGRLAVPPASAPSTPPPPQDPAATEVARALREARRELQALEARIARESGEEGARIAEDTQAISVLREDERELLDKLHTLQVEAKTMEAKAAEGARAEAAATAAMKDFALELETQAARFRSRFAGTLAAAQDPTLLEALKEALNTDQPVSDRLPVLLNAYGTALSLAGSTGASQLPVQVTAAGRLERLTVLRLGLLGGYYARPSRREGGFVLPDSESPVGFVAECEGLDERQKLAVIGLVQKPEKGGRVPADVTGGLGIASLRGAGIGGSRLALGDPLLWPLLGLAALAALLCVERFLVLGVKSAALVRGAPRVLRLIRQGSVEAASAAAHRLGGPARRVLLAALESREQEREILEGAVEEAYLREEHGFRARLGLLRITSSLALLLGFLGTITGLLGTFRTLGALGAADPRTLTGGISEALVSTQAGILLAVPCLLASGLLGGMAGWGLGKLEAAGRSAVLALLQNRAQLTAGSLTAGSLTAGSLKTGSLQVGEPA